MKRDRAEPPIFVAAFELTRWLLDAVDGDTRPVATAVAAAAVELGELIALAAQGFERAERLAVADEMLVRLRLRIRWAAATGVLTDGQALHAADQLLDVGRQLGGWRRVRTERRRR